MELRSSHSICTIVSSSRNLSSIKPEVSRENAMRDKRSHQPEKRLKHNPCGLRPFGPTRLHGARVA
ncbi:hypothetical protein CEXT_124821 [Caerostris extrusa]|uniref:Ycf15 n=1 Tax=Caerostris extrusa TaxID=172846 RepID=A0AAV4QTU8_CAEEX|nr:hypothetical protein CEXT_124821 [Caerostris extrusa]